jgi:hypothetical protein
MSCTEAIKCNLLKEASPSSIELIFLMYTRGENQPYTARAIAVYVGLI